MKRLEEIKYRSKYHLYPQDTEYLISEIERLREEVYIGIATIAKFEVDTKHLKVRTERLGNIIKVYGNHKWDCEIHPGYETMTQKCTCGFEQALKEE